MTVRTGPRIIALATQLATLFVTLTVAASASGAVMAQDAAAPPPEAEGVSQVVTAAGLAAWGRARSDPGALIMAARLLAEVPLRSSGEGPEAFLTPDTLLDEAEALSGGHPSWLAAIAHVRDSTRGVRSSPFGQGPIFTVKEMQARETWGFDVEARGGEVLRVAAIGDGDTNIDLRVRDSSGALVCEDGFGDHYPVCTVRARQDGRMRIDIVNRGEVWTKVQILSN